jgi:hypothetical protein
MMFFFFGGGRVNRRDGYYGVKDTRAPLPLAHVKANFSFQGSGSRLSICLNSCTSLTRVYEASVRANCSGRIEEKKKKKKLVFCAS